MKKYEIYECNVCKRQTEKEVDPLRPTIHNCTITYKCTGKLIKIGDSATKQIKPSFDSSVRNWIPRGTKLSEDHEPIEIGEFSILAGSHYLALGVQEGAIQDSSFDVTFEVVKAQEISFKEYIYNKASGATIISGPDDSPSNSTLKILPGDSIKILINGVVIPSTDYTIDSYNRIILNDPLIEESNLVKVAVFVEPQAITKTLTFSINSDFKHSWNNVQKCKYINPETGEYQVLDVFTCNDLIDIEIDDRLNPQDLGFNALLLLAYQPWTCFDRITDKAVDFSDILPGSDYAIEYKKNDLGEAHLVINKNVIKNIVPNIIPHVKYADDQDTYDVAQIEEYLDNNYTN